MSAPEETEDREPIRPQDHLKAHERAALLTAYRDTVLDAGEAVLIEAGRAVAAHTTELRAEVNRLTHDLVVSRTVNSVIRDVTVPSRAAAIERAAILASVLDDVRGLAKVNALTSHARGHGEEERRWLDLLHLLDHHYPEKRDTDD